jgi:hypothetical protein
MSDESQTEKRLVSMIEHLERRIMHVLHSLDRRIARLEKRKKRPATGEEKKK